jgi:hypothetical protein
MAYGMTAPEQISGAQVEQFSWSPTGRSICLVQIDRTPTPEEASAALTGDLQPDQAAIRRVVGWNVSKHKGEVLWSFDASTTVEQIAWLPGTDVAVVEAAAEMPAGQQGQTLLEETFHFRRAATAATCLPQRCQQGAR